MTLPKNTILYLLRIHTYFAGREAVPDEECINETTRCSACFCHIRRRP